MTTPRPAEAPAQAPAGIDLSQNEFWGLPPGQRHAAFAQLRALGQPVLFAEPETGIASAGEGYYALVRHADVSEASRHPELFSSARGATSIVDLPAEFNEYFGSMISMDDPRHARLRRIVSRAFTPKMIKRFEEDVQRAAARIVDDLLAIGPCDFVGPSPLADTVRPRSGHTAATRSHPGPFLLDARSVTMDETGHHY